MLVKKENIPPPELNQKAVVITEFLTGSNMQMKP